MSKAQLTAVLTLALLAAAAEIGMADANPKPQRRSKEWLAGQLAAEFGEQDQAVIAAQLEKRGLASSPLDATLEVAAEREPALASILRNEVNSDGPRDMALSLPEDLKQRLEARPILMASAQLFLLREAVLRGEVDAPLKELDDLNDDWVVDPVTLSFLKGVCQYRLQKRDDALATLESLLASGEVPARYRAMAKLMVEELKVLDPEKLRGIAHDMRDVHRRLDRGATDDPVQEKEKDILSRLDKLIEDLENQQQQQQSSSSGSQNAPASPMDDSRIAGAGGKGEADDRELKSREAWGNLPPKDRDKVLQNIDRDFPAQYREAIEQYFRQMADDGSPAGGPPLPSLDPAATPPADSTESTP